MPEEISTVVARLVDEVTPAAQKMRENFTATMEQVSADVLRFESVFESIDSYIPDFSSAVSSFQEMIENSASAGDYLTMLGEIASQTGNAYVDMGLQTVETLTGILGSSEEILGGVGEFFNQFGEDALTSATGFASAVSDIGAQLVAQAKNQVEAQRKADIDKVKNSTKSEEEKAKAIEEINKKAEAEKKKIAIAEKAMAITKAVVSSALAVVNALATPPFPVGLAMAAAAGIAGAAQVAAISAQSFAGGGIVAGTSFSGDNVAARVNSGEMVLNRAQQSQLFAMANGQGGGNTFSVGGDTIVINGNADQNTVNQIRQTKQEQMEEMKDLIREMKYHGQLEI